MQIRISARHGHLSEATQSKIASRVEKLSKHFDRLTAMSVTVDLGNEKEPSVELVVSAERCADFVATDRGTSLFGAVDGVVHKIEQQLRKKKEKVQDRHRNAGTRREEIVIEGESEE